MGFLDKPNFPLCYGDIEDSEKNRLSTSVVKTTGSVATKVLDATTCVINLIIDPKNRSYYQIMAVATFGLGIVENLYPIRPELELYPIRPELEPIIVGGFTPFIELIKELIKTQVLYPEQIPKPKFLYRILPIR